MQPTANVLEIRDLVKDFPGVRAVNDVSFDILAYGGYWLMGDEAHIVNVATHPDVRRRGYGEITVMRMVEAARAAGAHLVTLEVRMSNRVAQKLYAKLGFVEVGERRRYYNDNGEDALLMTLFLESAPAEI